MGTTALVAAGLLGTGEAAAKFDVTVRGNYTAGYGFVNEDDDEGESGHRRQNQALNQDAEVHFPVRADSRQRHHRWRTCRARGRHAQ